MSETSQERNESRPGDGDAVMIYFNPELLQTIADKSAQRRRDFEELLSSAEEGDLDAAYRLARAYGSGSDGAPKDADAAFRWYKRAAEGDHIAAQYGLGQCYARGIGTEKDPERAVELFAETAEQGYAPGICELGLCYELGSGVEMDKERAAEL